MSPVLSVSNEISDTVELFLRSYQLESMFEHPVKAEKQAVHERAPYVSPKRARPLQSRGRDLAKSARMMPPPYVSHSPIQGGFASIELAFGYRQSLNFNTPAVISGFRLVQWVSEHCAGPLRVILSNAKNLSRRTCKG